MMEQHKKGRLIAFEGIDGCGKTTQVKLLVDHMTKLQLPVYQTCEATHSDIGSLLRKGITKERPMDGRVIAAMYVADRLDHILNENDGLLKKINDGINVITDRYYFSSYAYNSADMGLEWVVKANSVAKSLLKPDLTIFIDVSADVALDRIQKNRSSQDFFETKERLNAARHAYYEAINTNNDKAVFVVNGGKSVSEIEKEIRDSVHYMVGESSFIHSD